MQLTDDQKAAAAAFTAFMVSPDKEMVISGPAGVGKSTLLKYLMSNHDHIKIQKLLGVDAITNWELTATTNKAAEVLQGSTGQEAKTVHSLLGIQVRPDFKTGKQILSRKSNASILTDSVLIVDECSMIDYTLRQLINESTYNCKILYVGDHCQMAPVMEDLSPVFKDNNPVQILQIVRSQNTPAITKLCTQLRATVETGVFTKIEEVPGIIDYLDPDQAQNEIRKHFVDDPEGIGQNCRILAYRNDQVIGFNNWIRTERDMPLALTEGEWAVSNAATMLINGKGQRLRIEQELKILDIGEIESFAVSKGTSLYVREVLTTQGSVWVPEDPKYADELVKYYAKQKDWQTVYRIKDVMADLRPRNACTVYKSQGSTYHTVFVDLKDIGRCTNANQAARMLYVACSRPTDRIFLIGDLPERFKGA